ncbi:M56 family metallopeptidase [Winogradskyella sp. UBA3174]|uniref:M56 family metallopeptidase n=1 Tax=Winogradskyella sp. UBA3174 TaxID=1947785 RepID=UPI0025E02F7E|nr:M56 family metallopeptidase [Winogradskyella sp. UBA3174]|tara:strand:- start:17587 stop:19962 length:2376 start_codon:yes stop_codon:yes gene_type:complete
MLHTIIQIIAFQALFLLVYDLFLKGETFFNYNRAYLLITSVLSLILPFINLPKLKTMATNNFIIQLPEVFLGTKPPTDYDIFIAEQAGIIIDQPTTPLWQTVLISGIVLTTLFFLFKITKLYVMKKRNPQRWKGNILIVSLIKSTAAFSFFNTIFLGEQIPETEKPTIYKHELVHIKEYHTVDLLFFEVLRIFMWFNPLVYLYQNRIKELHEYIADEKAVKHDGKSMYYQNLLNQIFDVHNVSFTNTFFKKSLIKKRIAMLQKSKSKQLNLIKYALLIPMVFGMLIYTSTEVRAQEKVASKTEVNQELTDAELQKKYYDELVAMAKNGASFTEIMNYVGFTDKNKHNYIKSRKEYLKIRAYMEFTADGMLERKSENMTLTQQDVSSAERMKLNRFKSYEDYRVWKKTDEAKELWELNKQDGVLRLVVKDLGNMTDKERKRFDDLNKQMGNDSYLRKLVVSEALGGSRFIVDSPNNSQPDSNGTVEVLESIEVPFSVIEEVPTLKECKDLATNTERKKCISTFITKFVNKHFNVDLADSLGLSSGRKRVFVSFKINKEGFVSEVKARGAHLALETEAVRVVSMLPQFIPGKQKGKVVTVPYSLPMVFQVQGENTSNTSMYDEFIKDLQDKKINEDSLSKDKKDELYKSYTQKRKEELYFRYLEEKINQLEDNTDAIPFSAVELAPAFVDCELITDNNERKKCTFNSVASFVNKNFNLDLASKLGVKGRQKIFIFFIIDKKGNVTNIQSRAMYPELESEAKRVINMLPKFMPGKQEGEVVGVSFSIPVVFEVQ